MSKTDKIIAIIIGIMGGIYITVIIYDEIFNLFRTKLGSSLFFYVPLLLMFFLAITPTIIKKLKHKNKEKIIKENIQGYKMDKSLMKMEKGKVIFRSKTNASNGVKIAFLIPGLISLSAGIIFTIIDSINLINSKGSYSLTFLYFSIFMLVIGLIFLLVFISFLVSFLVIYENGILIRNLSFFTFFKRSYINFENIKEIREDLETSYSRLIDILTNLGKIYKIDEFRVSKLEDAKNLIEVLIAKKN